MLFHPGTQDLPQVAQGEWQIPQATPPVRDIVLQTVGLTKAYGKRLAVKGLNLEVIRGEVFGFLGPNGAGKTTTIRMLLNLIKPTSGEVRLFGQPLTQNAHDLLPHVGALIEQPAFQSYLSGRDNLIAVGGYTGGVPASRVDEVLEIVGLSERAKDYYSTYSLGMRQRLGVGAALLTDPELIILDEPTRGIDVKAKGEIYEIIFHLAKLGRAILLISSDLPELMALSDRIAMMREGQIRGVVERHEFSQVKLMNFAFGADT